MAQTDSSATRTPIIFVAIAVTLFIARVATAAEGSAQGTQVSTGWRMARDLDRKSLPGAEDLKDADANLTIRVSKTQAQPAAVTVNPLTEADLQAVENGRLVLYEFVADWSDPCKTMDAKALSNQQVSQTIQQNFVPVRIRDVAREHGKNPKWISNLQKRYHIFALPTLVVTDREGEARASLIGNCSSLTVERFLARAIATKAP